ncbi:hypothetical protein CapIbe_004195 [Capra ibex]
MSVLWPHLSAASLLVLRLDLESNRSKLLNSSLQTLRTLRSSSVGNLVMKQRTKELLFIKDKTIFPRNSMYYLREKSIQKGHSRKCRKNHQRPKRKRE